MNVTHSYPLYDKIGNRLRTVYGGTGRALVSSYDALNRLLTCEERDSLSTPSSRITSYAYDLGGRVTRKTLPNGNACTGTFRWGQSAHHHKLIDAVVEVVEKLAWHGR